MLFLKSFMFPTLNLSKFALMIITIWEVILISKALSINTKVADKVLGESLTIQCILLFGISYHYLQDAFAALVPVLIVLIIMRQASYEDEQAKKQIGGPAPTSLSEITPQNLPLLDQTSLTLRQKKDQ